MPQNPDLDLSDLEKGGLWGFNATAGKWKPVSVNDAGELVTTAGAGGGGVDPVSIKDGTVASQKLGVDASGRITVNINGTVTTDPSDRDARLLGRVKLLDAGGAVYDARDMLDRDARVVGRTKIHDGTDVLAVAADGSIAVTDNGGTLSVDDGAGSLTVDPNTGTVWDVSDRAARLLGITSSDFADRSTFTDGTSRAGVVAGVFNETQTAPTEDQAAAVRITDKRALHVSAKPHPFAAADILTGRAVRLNTTTAVAIITIPAGRTWYGTVSISAIATATAAATKLTADVRTAGTSVTPAVGTQVLELITHHGGTSAPFVGLTSGEFYVIAPVGNSVTLDLKLDVASANFEAVASARGVLL